MWYQHITADASSETAHGLEWIPRRAPYQQDKQTNTCPLFAKAHLNNKTALTKWKLSCLDIRTWLCLIKERINKQPKNKKKLYRMGRFDIFSSSIGDNIIVVNTMRKTNWTIRVLEKSGKLLKKFELEMLTNSIQWSRKTEYNFISPLSKQIWKEILKII